MKAWPISYLAVVPILVTLLTACQSVEDLYSLGGSNKLVPPCPAVKFSKDMDKITVFKTGSGQDITDIIYEAELTASTGECEYISDDNVYTSVVLTLQVDMDVTSGPAANTRPTQLNYFVAIPEFFPEGWYLQPAEMVKGYKSAKLVVTLPPKGKTIGLVDDPIYIRIPLNEHRSGPQTRVIMGFVLSKDQLEFNQQQGAGIRLGG